MSFKQNKFVVFYIKYVKILTYFVAEFILMSLVPYYFGVKVQGNWWEVSIYILILQFLGIKIWELLTEDIGKA